MSKEHEKAPLKDEKFHGESKTDSKKNGEASGKTINPQLVISFILLLIFAIFAIVNTQEVVIRFVVADLQIPLIIVILGSFILGAVTTALTGWRSRRKKTKK